MENQGQLNNNGQSSGLNMGTEFVYLPSEDMEEYDMDSLMGEGDEDHLNAHQATVGEECPPKKKRGKRFTVAQLQELESSFQLCTHPDDETRQVLAAKVGIEVRQVKFWFQNRRSQIKVKSYGAENNNFRKQNAELIAKNKELQEQLRELSCSRCRDPTAMKWQLLDENAELKKTYWHANANLSKFMQEAKLPPVIVEHLSSANSSAIQCPSQAELISYAEHALKEFMILTMNGLPLCLSTMGGKMLNNQDYTCQRFPGRLGLCPQGFVTEATRHSCLIRGTASDLALVLTDVGCWSEMFPGIVADVRASHVIAGGNFSTVNGLIQEMTVDLWVQSPRVPLRTMKFVRISKQMASGEWAIVDVSTDGTLGFGVQEGGHNKHTSCRLMPSGCLLQDMGDGHCQVTWIVHMEYQESTVPPLFRQFFQSGQAFGASRWLRSLQSHCEYLAAMYSSHVPSSDNSGVAIPALGRRNLLEVAKRMTMMFYKTMSRPATQEQGNMVTKWVGRRGAAGEMLEPAVRMVLGNYSGAVDGEASPSLMALSATTTVWLPGTPPESVFEYICNGQRRGEWDSFIYAGAVHDLASVATSPYVRGNAVSVLRPNETDAINSTMLLLQQTSVDASCSLVVYSLVEKNVLCSIMGGGDNTSSVYILPPSGFAILPDGHGNANHASASSSSASAGHGRPAGCFLTATYQSVLTFSDQEDAEIFDNAGKRVYCAIKKIMAAVGADVVVPA